MNAGAEMPEKGTIIDTEDGLQRVVGHEWGCLVTVPVEWDVHRASVGQRLGAKATSQLVER